MTDKLEITLPEATQLPSHLRKPGERVDQIQKRINVIKQTARHFQIEPPRIYAYDEHYWGLVTNEYHGVFSTLQSSIPDRQTRREAAMTIAMKTAETIADIEQRASIDSLTGATLRETGMSFIGNINLRNIPASIIFTDIDDFSKYNDERGHHIGDMTLQNFVRVIREKIRPGIDMIFRYGGEEFVIVQPGVSDLTVAERNAEKIRKAVHYADVTASFGVTMLNSGSIEQAQTVVKRADRLMYQAKRNGKDIVYSDRGPVEKSS